VSSPFDRSKNKIEHHSSFSLKKSFQEKGSASKPSEDIERDLDNFQLRMARLFSKNSGLNSPISSASKRKSIRNKSPCQGSPAFRIEP